MGILIDIISAARLALSNFEALNLHLTLIQEPSSEPKIDNGDTETETGTAYVKIQYDLEDSTGCITDTIKRFLAQGVAHHLPIDTYAVSLPFEEN
jgi:hypothetical protein